MSILTSVTSLFEPIKTLGNPSEECKQTKPDECGDDKHKGREELKNNDHDKQGKNDDHRNDDHRDHDKQAKNDDHKNDDHRDDHDKQAKNDDHKNDDHRDDHNKQAKNDDHKNDDHRDDHDKQARNDDHKNDDHRDDHDKQARNDDHKNDDHRDDHDKQAKNDDHKNDDCQQHKNDCQPQKDHCDAKPSDECGKSGDTYHNPGEALAKFDFSQGNLGSAPDHSDTHAALASMSSDHALDYAIGQMSPAADHFDIAHDVPVHTSHDDVAHHA